MPVILPLEVFDLWLDCANVDAVIAAALLTAPREDFFEAYEISSAVNGVAGDVPLCLNRSPNLQHQPGSHHHTGDRGSSDEYTCQMREEAQER
jgi:hypothetical protein